MEFINSINFYKDKILLYQVTLKTSNLHFPLEREREWERKGRGKGGGRRLERKGMDKNKGYFFSLLLY